MPTCSTKACTDIKAAAKTYTGPGQFTYHAEGNEGGIFATRYPHQPDLKSGVTVGKGYDMKEKSPLKVKNDLISAGVPEADAEKLSKGAGLDGERAKEFISRDDIKDIAIDPEAQKALFKISHKEKVADVKRIFSKPDTVEKYGAVNQDTLDPAIMEMVVDMTFRGDYRPSSRKTLQPMIAGNDLAGFRAAVEKMEGIPSNRQKRRLEFLDQQINDKKKNLPISIPNVTPLPVSVPSLM